MLETNLSLLPTVTLEMSLRTGLSLRLSMSLLLRLRTSLCLEANFDSEVECRAMFEPESGSKLGSQFYYDTEEEVQAESCSSAACISECV